MNRYEHLSCPVCDEPFQPQDDIVVCPVCGTPQHRDCYKKLGRCVHEDWHVQGKRFEASNNRHPDSEKSDRSEEEQRESPMICPRCGEKNPSDAYFCQRCGLPLSGPFQQNSGQWQNGQRSSYQAPSGGGQQAPFGIPPVFFSPYAGMNPEEELAEGVTVREMSQYLGVSAPSFLVRFRRIAKEGKTVSWNLLFGLGGVFYTLYRKFYRLAVPLLLYTLLYVVTNLVITVFTYQQVLPQMSGDIGSLTEVYTLMEQALRQLPSGVLVLYNLSHYLLFPICILMGLFGDKLYFHYCIDRIRAIKSDEKAQDELPALLSQKGGVSKMSLLLSLIFVFMAMFVVPNVLAVIMMGPML